MKTSTAVTVAGATVATGVLAYAFYFDYKRRNDTTFRKKLRKDKKKVEKTTAQLEADDVTASTPTTEQLRTALLALQNEPLPVSPQEKEAYFMTQVSLGEQMASQGPAFNLPSALAFYRALRVYPSPVELIVLYEKSVPPPVFKIVMDLMNLDVQTRAAGYYDRFPDRSMGVVVQVVKEPVEKKILVLDKDVQAGEVIYTEKPVVAVLDHDLQESGFYCTCCLRSVDPQNVIIPPVDRFNSVYCSVDCEARSKHQSQNLLFGRESVLPPALLPLADIPGSSENRNAAQIAFANYLNSNGKSLPLLVARFAARQVEAEIGKMIPLEMRAGDAPANDENSQYDHMERLRYVDTEVTLEERTLLSNVLAAALPGLERLLGDDRHDIVKGKIRYNSLGVCFNGGRDDKPALNERPEDIERTRTPYGTSRQIGTAFYYVSSYLAHSCDPNVRPSFDETGTSELSLIALRDLKKGDELMMAYVDVSQRPDESAIDARRRRRQELARGWKFACECPKCATDLTQAGSPDAKSSEKANDNDLGVPLEEAKLEETVARVEAQLAQATLSAPSVPASGPTPYDADDDHATERTQESTT